MHALRDLGRYDTAVRYASDALNLPPRTREHARCTPSCSPLVQAAKGDLDEATGTASQIRAEATAIKSARLDDRLNEFAARLAPHRATRIVADYLSNDSWIRRSPVTCRR